MCIHLIDLARDAEVATMGAFQFLSKVHPSVEVGLVQVEDASTGAVYLLHHRRIDSIDGSAESVSSDNILACLHHITFVQITNENHLPKRQSSPVLQLPSLCAFTI